jgi:DNA-directed RNA polymerase subunit RPC12/RpoP
MSLISMKCIDCRQVWVDTEAFTEDMRPDDKRRCPYCGRVDRARPVTPSSEEFTR